MTPVEPAASTDPPSTPPTDATAFLPSVSLVAGRFAEPRPTGIGRYYREFALALAANGGVRVELASPPEPDAPDWLSPGLGHRTITGNRQAMLMAWCLTGRPRLDRRLGHPDIVHVLHPWVATPTRAPLMVTIHDLMPVLHPEWYSRKEVWAYRKALDHVRDAAAKVVCVSGFVADQVHDVVGIDRARLVAVHSGIGPAFTRAAADRAGVTEACARHGLTPGTYFVTVGQVSDRKNLRVVVEALASLPPDPAPGPDLVIAGPPGQGADRLHALVAELDLTERVRFTGYLPDGDLPLLVAGSRALLHPSRDEGFGFTPLEAMAAGTATVSSTSGSLPEVVGAAGVLADPDDAASWARAMDELRRNPDHRDELVRRGRTHVEPFGWSRTAATIVDLYREVRP